MTLWPKVPAAFVRRVLHGHKILGLALCASLYLICLTGWVGVYYVEFERWERPNLPEFSEVTPEAIARATADTRAVMLADTHRGPFDTDIYISPPTDNAPRLVVGYGHEARGYDAQGNFKGPASHDLTHFLTELHYYLHLPESFGMIVVCLFGVGMMALLIGGALSHPKMFRDAFAFRLRKQGHLTRADLHNRIGAWTLPFGLIITLTGTLIGLGQLVALTMGLLYYQGNSLKAYEPIFGSQAEITAATGGKPLQDGALLTALRQIEAARPDEPVSFIAVRMVGTPTEFLEITTKPSQRLVYGEAWRFDAQGHLKGSYHLSDGPAGRQVAASLYSLHFGDFGGWSVKLIYALLGFGLTVMIAAGMDIWLIKSAEKGKPRPLIHRLWTVLIYGAPALIALAFALAMSLHVSPVAVFWGGMAILTVVTLISPKFTQAPVQIVSRLMRTGLGLSLIAMVAVHQTIHQSFSVAAVQVNLTLLILGLGFVALTLRKVKSPANTEV
ncbi:PepSY-associated TM helix domain-containing protein [Asticcacaulis sp. BYS171W]|uniref:PepSY-associated TM helix domain-containing protein n=1 Tax=Asticcacaulis aquaticus TaxID=2984212 RepID=A0ABT5HYH2_9CAUL|nr:PepSY-associated TM helix domain-containing protein [Asticcacaulis aquaticus]MDC7685122.1 PepSY-associated TM helix domain-containing protein [Asticcacaulis aquaticus]